MSKTVSSCNLDPERYDTKKILEYSINNRLKHIPSALSQYSYLKYILPLVANSNYKIVIGKPFGAQAYYCIWKDIYNLPEILSYGVKHDELSFVDFSEETLGNALGVASGIAISQSEPVYCNISDGAIQMGATQEAIQFIGFHKLKILVTIDCNNEQLTGSTDDIIGINIEKISEIFKLYDWNVYIDNFNINVNFPAVILYHTKKGNGVKEMEDNPSFWHYKEVKDLNEITII